MVARDSGTIVSTADQSKPLSTGPAKRWNTLFFHTIGRPNHLALLTAAALHLLGLGALALPWQGDLIPGRLYQMDTETDDQVEQLGLLTTLRLDIKHLFLPPKITPDRDFEPMDPGTSGAASSDEMGGEEEPEQPQA